MRLFSIFIFIFLLYTENYSQVTDTIYLWTGSVPGEKGPKHGPVQTPDTSRGVTRLTDVTDPALLVFKPETSVNNGSSIIICPGGGYRILAIDIEGSEIAKWLNKLGFTAYVLQYRVPDKKQEALYDIQRAVRLVRNRTKTGKTGVLGFSAGGSLCARACTLYNRETYPETEPVDSISCRPDFAVLIYPAYLDQGEDRSLTPELKVDKNTPPMFIFGTADDKYGNSSLVMAGALRDNEVPVELHFLSFGGHGYGLRPGNAAAETWPRLAAIWLKKITPESEF